MGVLLLSHDFDEIKEPRINATTAADSDMFSKGLMKVLDYEYITSHFSLA